MQTTHSNDPQKPTLAIVRSSAPIRLVSVGNDEASYQGNQKQRVITILSKS